MVWGSVLLTSLLLAVPQPAECADVGACREAAVEAAARKDFEAFHDLAWRAVQRGRRNDPELMYLLARAQSLSGRPGDALVMLRRIAGLGVSVDAGEHDDFRAVRALPGWAEVEALLAGAAGPRLETGALEAATNLPPSSTPPPAAGAPAAEAPAAPAAARERSAPPARAATPLPPRAPGSAPAAGPAPTVLPLRGEAARRLTAAPIDPAGLAYDSASRRFVLGDRRANKLIVADEVFDQVNDLIGAAAGGFGTLTALAIDSRRGDLWVTSAGDGGRASLHKLQLVSGRVLSSFDLPEPWHPLAIRDLAVTGAGTLLLLDAEGSRLFTRAATTQLFDRVINLPVKAPASLALNRETAYVAHERGLSMVDTSSGRLTEIRAAPGLTLSGLRRIRWHAASLVAIQEHPEHGRRIVRIRMDRGGTSATAVDLIDEYPPYAGSALTIAGDTAYYLVEDDGVQVIRRVPLH